MVGNSGELQLCPPGTMRQRRLCLAVCIVGVLCHNLRAVAVLATAGSYARQTWSRLGACDERR